MTKARNEESRSPIFPQNLYRGTFLSFFIIPVTMAFRLLVREDTSFPLHQMSHETSRGFLTQSRFFIAKEVVFPSSSQSSLNHLKEDVGNTLWRIGAFMQGLIFQHRCHLVKKSFFFAFFCLHIVLNDFRNRVIWIIPCLIPSFFLFNKPFRCGITISLSHSLSFLVALLFFDVLHVLCALTDFHILS